MNSILKLQKTPLIQFYNIDFLWQNHDFNGYSILATASQLIVFFWEYSQPKEYKKKNIYIKKILFYSVYKA